MLSVSRLALVGFALLAMGVAGCSGGADVKVPVRGKLVDNGQPFVLDRAKMKAPVKGAGPPPGSRPIQISFIPVDGGEMLGAIVNDSDWTFEVPGTEGKGLKPGKFARHEAASAVVPLIGLLHDEDSKVVAVAAMALGSIGAEARSAVPALADLVMEPRNTNRANAVTALGMIRQSPEVSVPTLIGALAIAETRPAAISAVSLFGAAAMPAVPALLAIGRDEKGSVRPEVFLALARIEPDGAAFSELLFAGLRDPSPFVRGAAVNYCAREPGVPAALPVLIELFMVDGALRDRIAYAFGALGEDAKPVVPMLLEMIRDPQTNQHLRQVLINALQAIDPDSVKPPAK